MSTTQFVAMYHPLISSTITTPARVAVQAVDERAAQGWLLVDPDAVLPDPVTPYYTKEALLSQISAGAAPIGTALRAAFDAWGGGGGAGVNAADVGYDVVLLIGQSNVVGSNTDYDPRLDPVDPRVWTFDYSGTYAGKLSIAQDKLGHQALADGVGPGVPLGRWFGAGRPSNRRVLLVPAAKGATALARTTGETWNSTVRGSLFDNAVTHAQAALAAAGPNARLVGAVWVQGEGDAGVDAAAYRTALDQLIGDLRSTLGLPNLPFVVGGMVPENIAAVATLPVIAAVHADTPSRVAGTVYVPGPAGFTNGADVIHYSGAGQRIQGRRMAAALLGQSLPPLPGSAPALTNSVAPAITGTATTGSVLTVSDGTWSATPDSFTRQWKRGGTTIAGATGTTYTLVQADEGQAITCTVTAVKAGYASGTATSNTVTPSNGTTPVLTNSTAPAITGTATTGQTLTVSNGTWSATPDSFTYQWKRAGANISGATSATYVLQVPDEGQAITATVTAIKAGYTSGVATSNSVTPAAAANPAADVGPALQPIITPVYGPGLFGTARTGGVLATASQVAGIRTLEGWVRTSDAAGTQVALGAPAPNNMWMGKDGTGRLLFAAGSSGALTGTGPVINDGQWHHIALTVDATDGARAFVDGQQVGTAAAVTGATTGAFGIGSWGNTEYNWVGDVDEVRASSVVRYSGAFTAPSAPFTTDGNTLALYHLNG